MPSPSTHPLHADPLLTPQVLRVLLVDDQLIIAEAIRRMLGSETDIEYHFVTDARAARERALSLRPTVILQDLVMPELDGFALLAAYRADPVLAEVPVIVLSSRDEAAIKAQSVAAGASDYLVKLPDRLDLVARIRYHSGAQIARLQRDEALALLRESRAALTAAEQRLAELAR